MSTVVGPGLDRRELRINTTAAHHQPQEQDKGGGATLGVQTETPLDSTTSNTKLENPMPSALT